MALARSKLTSQGQISIPAEVRRRLGVGPDHQSIALEDADVVAAALAHFRDKPTIGFSDCLIVEIARKAGHLPLGAFDRALSRLDGAERL